MSEKEEEKKKKAEPWQEIQRMLAEQKEDIGEVYSRLSVLEKKTLSQKGEGEGAKTGVLCPDCGVYVGDPWAHLRKEPEKHGLLKTVEKEVTKEVPQMRTFAERLAEHDFFDCKDCRKVIDEHLAKKGLKIVKAEKEEFVLEL